MLRRLALLLRSRSRRIAKVKWQAQVEPMEGRLLLACPDPGFAGALDLAGALEAERATVTGTAWDIGGFPVIFDQDLTTRYRSENINPAFVQIAFAEPTTF